MSQVYFNNIEQTLMLMLASAKNRIYVAVAWFITIYIDDNNREKVDYWMKEYYKCLKRNRGLSVMIKSKYERFVESLEGRYHDKKT